MIPLQEGDKPVAGSFANMIEVSQDHKIMTDGPLSHMFTSALYEIYGKEVDQATGIAVESQALDAHRAQNLWMASKIAGSDDEVGMLYGVLRTETSVDDVMRVADTLTEMTDAEKSKSAIVIVTDERDAASGQTFQQFHYADSMARKASPLYAHQHDWGYRVYRDNNVFARSLEQVAAAHGVKTFASLEAYTASLKKG